MEVGTNTNQILMSDWQLGDVSDTHSLSHAQHDSYDGLMNSHDHDSGYGVERTQGGGPDNTTFQSRTPSPSPSSGANDEDSGSNHTEPQKVRFSNPFGNWWWEIGAASFSVACVASIVAVLYAVQDKARSDWRFLILPNSLVAIFSTLSRASLMVPVASCISQLKWIHFTHAPDALSHIQVFDEASRGPWGALTLLCTVRSQKWLVTWGAIITIVALAVEPFVQAIITYPQREVRLFGQASFGTAYIYGGTYDYILDTDRWGGAVITNRVMDPKMQGAVLNGVYNLDSPVKFQCSTGNCFWPAFTTIGACYQCRNVSTEVQVSCGQITWPSEYLSSNGANYTECKYTTSGGIVFTKRNTTRVGSSDVQVNATTGQGDRFAGGRWNWIYTTPTTLLALISTANISSLHMEQKEQDVMECSVNMCAKTFHNMKVTNGTFFAGPIKEIGLGVGRMSPDEEKLSLNGNEWLFGLNTTATATTDPSSSVPLPGNGTVILDSMDFELLSEYIAEVFNSSIGTAFGNALRSSPNITETIANVSTSVTYAFGTSRFANQTLGFAITTEQYIHVRWAWLTLPLAVVLMGVVLLALTIVYSSRSGITSWKSSSILPIFAQLDGWSEDYLRAAIRPMKELEQKAKKMCGVVKVDGDAGKVLFVNTARGTTEMRDV